MTTMQTEERGGTGGRCPKLKLSVSLDPELVRQADRRWRLTGQKSRSALLEEALERYLAEIPEEIPPHLTSAAG